MVLPMIRSTILASKNACKNIRFAHKYSEAVKHNPLATVTELSNGVRVATEQTNSPSATVGIWADTGSSAEPKELNGITHFIEHLLFQGTKNRAKKQLEQDVYSLGALLNSSTQRDFCSFYMTLAPNDVSKAVEILSDLIQNSSLNADDIEATRKFILRELDETQTNYEQVVMDNLHSVAYQQTPLGFSKYGPTANIERFTKADIERGLDLIFKAPQLVVACSGKIDHDKLVADCEKNLKGLTNVFEKNQIPDLYVSRYTGSDIRVRDDSMNCAHIAIALEAPGYNNPDHVTMDVAASIMGNWDLTHGGATNVSCFMGMVSASEHLAQSFQSFNLKYKDTALWGSYFVGERMQLEDLLFNLQSQWKQLIKRVANNEIKMGKNILMSKLIAERGDSANNANSIATDVLRYGRRITLEEWAERINRVNANKMHSVMEEYVWDRCPAVSGLGPVENFPLYEEIRYKMSTVIY